MTDPHRPNDPNGVRRRILLRRAKFVAAAMASAGVAAAQASACSPCLSVDSPDNPQPDGGASAITVEAVPPASIPSASAEPLAPAQLDAGRTQEPDAGDQADTEPPIACLKVAPRSTADGGKARPCLSRRPPKQPPLVCLEPLACLFAFDPDDLNATKK